MKEEIVTCDKCGEKVNYENRFEVYIKPKNGNLQKFCKHELCNKHWNEFMEYLKKLKND